jgi:hypothetical protein
MRRLLAVWLNKERTEAAQSHQRDHAIRFYEKSANADPSWSVYPAQPGVRLRTRVGRSH